MRKDAAMHVAMMFLCNPLTILLAYCAVSCAFVTFAAPYIGDLAILIAFLSPVAAIVAYEAKEEYHDYIRRNKN